MSNNSVIRSYRDQISELDLKILEALNERIQVVKQLKDYKASRGLDFHDAAQEERVLAALSKANPGPLPDDGLKALFRLILAWTRRTVEPGEAKLD